jgi:16S rRNA processing protein RimM
MDDTDTLLGYVTEILVTGANDVLIVKAENGGEYLIPVIEGVVTEIDLARNRITIHPLPGLIPE